MRKIISLYRKCSKVESIFVLSLIKYLKYKWYFSKNITPHHSVTIKGVANIFSDFPLSIGMEYVGFSHKSDITFLNICGRLQINGSYSIGRGCRFDIAEKAIVNIGKGGYINVNSTFIIMHGLTIGDNCIISWGCQFLDEDFHRIEYEGQKKVANEIVIGNNVWIGCGVKIYKGTRIPDGSVIAANSVVRGVFTKKNVLIGGHPAKIIKEKINWK